MDTKHQTYQIFGRRIYDQPLQYIDKLSVTDSNTLEQNALQRVGETGWVELIALPESAIIQVIPQEGKL